MNASVEPLSLCKSARLMAGRFLLLEIPATRLLQRNPPFCSAKSTSRVENLLKRYI
jgi:hypothetical protein